MNWTVPHLATATHGCSSFVSSFYQGGCLSTTLSSLKSVLGLYEFHISNFESRRSVWRVKFKFFCPLGFKIQSHFVLETTKIKLHSVRALKRYLNEKNLMHGRGTATIWTFSAQSLQTYSRWQFISIISYFRIFCIDKSMFWCFSCKCHQ